METAVQGPVQYTSQVPSLEDVQVDGDTFTHTKQNTNRATILFDPPINKGVVRFEVLSVRDLAQVGIANESVRYSRKEPSEAHGYDEVVIYNWTGGLSHLGDRIENDEFKSGDRVALELDMNSMPRTLTFFVNDVEQKNYLVNVPAAALLYKQGTQFKVLKFETLSIPTAKHLKGSRARKWGTEWEK